MRNLPGIKADWESGGPFIGDKQPITRVTVQEPWSDLATETGHENDFLRTTDEGVGTSVDRGVPLRWWQDQANSHTAKELPNIKSVNIDRSVDSDAGTLQIAITNQWMYNNNATVDSPSAGQPGYFTYDRGESADAVARWGHSTNEWNNMLVPNAVIRVWTGFGGDYGTYPNVADAVTAGKLALYGVFLVDEVRIATDGSLTITGRDMAKLLIDQQLFPPLIPENKYPLSYRRWESELLALRLARRVVAPNATTALTESDQKGIWLYDSSVERWFGDGAAVHGHVGEESFDGDSRTYALSVGHSDPSSLSCVDWWEYASSGTINAVYLQPWQGDYICYVSVLVGGVWQAHPDPPADDSGVIPYDPADDIAERGNAVDTGANINYVARFYIPHERACELILPQDYAAQRVRITLRNHSYSGLGTFKYHAGIRELRIRAVSELVGSLGPQTDENVNVLGTNIQATVHEPFTMAAAAIRDPDNIFSQGYITVSNFGASDVFGDARTVYPANNPLTPIGPTGAAMLPDGSGYYILDMHGQIRAHGDAVWYGDPADDGYTFTGTNPPWDIAITHTGNGYWVLRPEGTVHAYGDAADYGVNISATHPVECSSITSHPTEMGFWILRNDGKVFNFGSTSHFGNYPTIKVFNGSDANNPFAGCSERAHCIASNSDGTGYWILTSNGGVGNFGGAKGFGGPAQRVFHGENIILQSFWELLPSPDDKGYLLLHASGQVSDFGQVKNFGGPVMGTRAELRWPGNYCVDSETEVLSKRGWLRHSEIQVGDDVWSLDPRTNTARWSEVLSVFQKDVSDEPVRHIDTMHIDCLSTLEHRWWVDHPRHGWHWRTSDCLDSRSRIPLCAPSELPTEPTYDDDFVELVAWFWTEGSYGSENGDDYRASFSQSAKTNPDNVAEIDALLTRMYGPCGPLKDGYLWSRGVRDHKVTYRLKCTIRDLLAEFCVPFDKLVSWEFLTRLTRQQLDRYIDISLRADGHARGNSTTLSQGVKGRSDRFQAACALAGIGTALGYEPYREGRNGKPNQNESWGVSIRKTDIGLPFNKNSQEKEQRTTYTGVIWCPTTEVGTWFARRNGKAYFTGNSDYTDIAKDLALFSGFLFYDAAHPSDEPAPLYGAVETTGAWSDEPLPDDIFDKRPVIDALKEIREVVGYLCFVDSEGRFRFESPNFFRIGNYDESGNHIAELPEIDEKVNATSYSVSTADEPLRSSIIISSEDPNADATGTITHYHYPATASRLRGLVKPAMWVNSVFTVPREQRIMAELISLHIAFQERIGQVTCVAPVFLEINDQVRIYERQTAETSAHYVRGISFNHDLESGSYTTTLTTHWLATGDGTDIVVGGDVFTASSELQSDIDSQRFGKLARDPGERL